MDPLVCLPRLARQYFTIGFILVFSYLLLREFGPHFPYTSIFLCVFVFRYLRSLVGIYSYLTFKSVPVSENPTYLPSDVTVIIPTVEPFGEEFEGTVISAIQAGCAEIIVVTVGEERRGLALPFCQAISPMVQVLSIDYANKRAQVSRALEEVQTNIVVLADDHVFWPAGFLPSILAPFEDPLVGGVACCKRVRRCNAAMFSAIDFWNFIGSLYLERHNFDLAASAGVDGALFVISGRTAAYRSQIICDPAFRYAFCNEFWGPGSKVGPLNADDDNCLIRWVVNHGWKTAFQMSDASRMETTLGIGGFEKFNNQCLRWARTTWRSNSTSLVRDRVVWFRYPWSTYAIFISSFFNFALFTDATLAYTCYNAAEGELGYESARLPLVYLGLWIFASKLVKTAAHFRRHPRDLVYLFGCILFGYYHSLVKLWALFTVWDVRWGSRPGLVN